MEEFDESNLAADDGHGKYSAVADLEKYQASHIYGFVEQNTNAELDDYFKPWSDLAHQTEALAQEGSLRKRVQKLPVLDHTRLSSPSELKTALVYLTCISYGYVWCEGEDEIPEVLPRCLAVPYAAIAEKLQVPPSVSQYTMILLNWKLKDPSGKVELDNMESIVTMHGGQDESWFYCTTAQVELAFAPALSSIVEAQKAVVDKSTQRLVKHLRTIEGALQKMKQSISRMSEGCRPDVFFNVFRRFFTGWDSKAFKKKGLKGLVYEGVSTEPLCLTGLSAAQSSTFFCLDAAFGVVHNEQEVQSGSSLEAKEAFNDCLQAMKNFRDSHLQIVTRYIINQAHQKTQSEEPGNGATGTGGTDIMTFLKGMRDSTIRAFLGERLTEPGGRAQNTTVNGDTEYFRGDNVKPVVRFASIFIASAVGTYLIMKRLTK